MATYLLKIYVTGQTPRSQRAIDNLRRIEVRALPGGERILLLAVTGYGQPEDRRRAQAAGFDAHLVKPVDLDELSRLLAGKPGA